MVDFDEFKGGREWVVFLRGEKGEGVFGGGGERGVFFIYTNEHNDNEGGVEFSTCLFVPLFLSLFEKGK